MHERYREPWPTRTRRLVVNACYWGLEMEDQIKADGNVDIVGDYNPLPFRFGGFKRNVKPADLR